MHSPAKINIGLRVLERRASDGFHAIESIFVPISFGDEMIIEHSLDFSLTTENLLREPSRSAFEAVTERGKISDNLVWRCMQKLKAHSHEGLKVHLKKRIPAGAGLGGGSSNAGTLLRYFHHHYRQLLDDRDAFEIAADLGSDVPFFLHRKPRLVTGRGEILADIDVGPGWGVLCLPHVVVPTKEAYADLKRPLQPAPVSETVSELTLEIRQALSGSNWKGIRKLENDFESVVFPKFPVLAEVKEFFYNKEALYSSMTGSGSAIFALVETESRAEALKQESQFAFPAFQFESFSF